MKRLLLASLVCVVAVIVAPVASASAATPVKCTLKGKAKFNGNLQLNPKKAKYEFKTDGTVSNKCKVGTAEVEVEAKAEVKGEGELSCTVSPGLGVAGLAKFTEGELTAGSKKFELTRFEFVGAGPVVTFEAAGKNATEEFKGGGEANFLSSPGALLECASTTGLPEVEFQATSAGVVLP